MNREITLAKEKSNDLETELSYGKGKIKSLKSKLSDTEATKENLLKELTISKQIICKNETTISKMSDEIHVCTA